EGAISTASPLTGTAAPVAAVALNVPVAATPLEPEAGCCCCGVAVASKLVSDELAGAGAVATVVARSRPPAEMEGGAPSEAVGFAASKRLLPPSGLAAVAGCGAAALGAGVVGAVVLDLSDTSEAVSEVDDVVVVV